MLQKQARQFEH